MMPMKILDKNWRVRFPNLMVADRKKKPPVHKAIHISTNVVVGTILLLTGCGFLSSHFETAKESRIKTVLDAMRTKLDAYYQVTGKYPASLQVLGATNALPESLVSSVVRKTSYQHTQSSYILSYNGSFHSTMIVSNTPAPPAGSPAHPGL